MPAGSSAVEILETVRAGQPRTLSGRLVTEAEDGGLLLLTADAMLWALEPDEIVGRTRDDQPLVPLSQEALSRQLQDDMPAGFEIHTTAHYMVCYNTSKPYAQWCGALFERLYLAFQNYWTRRGLDLREPEFPLVALIFADKHSYVRHARGELGEAAEATIGYYSMRTNHVIMYDLTGLDALRSRGGQSLTTAQINNLLARAETERTVATIVHEATHQIAFNSGVHERYADIPLWLSEGPAMYFETPAFKSARGWRTLGGVNRVQLAEFRQLAPGRPSDALEMLISDNTRFRDPQQSRGAYSESWALAYYLIRTNPAGFSRYMRSMSKKKPLLFDSPDDRQHEFREAFGNDLRQLDADFVRHTLRLR